MISFSVRETADLLCGRVTGDADARFDRVSSDSRSIGEGALFVAIRGEHFDGHEFVSQVAEQGAVAALVERAVETRLPQIVVEDVLYAFGELATAWRFKSDAKVVGLTGSNGKTTVKEMIAAILRQAGSVLATSGNLNNDIGVPLTLTRLQDEQFAVIEMGANHPGEIRYLTRMTRPDIALLNNVGRAHLEGFGSLEGVAHAKAEIIEGLSDDGIFVCHGDAEWLPLWRELAGKRSVTTFGAGEQCDVRLLKETVDSRWESDGFHQRFSYTSHGEEHVARIALAGEHNCMNAVAAIAVCEHLGIAREAMHAGLATLTPVKGRLLPVESGGLQLLDDTYNANPDSVAAAVRLLTGLPGRSVMILGDLGELGEDALKLHAEIGAQARTAGVDRLFTLGEASKHAADAFGQGAMSALSLDELLGQLDEELDTGDVVLVKGSRSSRMERVVDALQEEGEQASC